MHKLCKELLQKVFLFESERKNVLTLKISTFFPEKKSYI